MLKDYNEAAKTTNKKADFYKSRLGFNKILSGFLVWRQSSLPVAESAIL